MLHREYIKIEALVRDAQRENAALERRLFSIALETQHVTEIQMDGKPVAVMARDGKWYVLGHEVKSR